MHTNTVQVTVDGKAMTIPAGTYSFSDLLAHLQLDKKTLRSAGSAEEVVSLSVTEAAPQPTVIRGNDSRRIHGGEVFQSVRQALPQAAA